MQGGEWRIGRFVWCALRIPNSSIYIAIMTNLISLFVSVACKRDYFFLSGCLK
jgi:hypothetical protein